MSADQKERAVAAIVGCVVSDAAGIVLTNISIIPLFTFVMLRNGEFHNDMDDVLLCSCCVTAIYGLRLTLTRHV